jgi:ABC-type transporter Mla subunit MlaD
MERTFRLASVNLATILARLKTLLGEKNQAQIERILAHTAGITEKLEREMTPERFEHFDEMVVAISRLSRSLDAGIPELRQLMRSGDALAVQAKVSLEKIEKDFDTMAETMRVLNERNKNGDYSVKQNIQPAMMQFEMTMHDLQQSLILLNQILVRYGDSPSDLLFEYQPPLVGPGEKK